MERGNYNSGNDFVLEYAALRFTFNEEDIQDRCELAARELELLPDRKLFDAEKEDLLDLLIEGVPQESPRSKLGEHLCLYWTDLEADRDDPDLKAWGLASWMRRLVFRQAWVDQRIIEGELEPVFTRRRGFVYVNPSRAAEDREISYSPAPSFAAHRYGR